MLGMSIPAAQKGDATEIEVCVKTSRVKCNRPNFGLSRAAVLACVAGAILVGCEKPAETTGVPETPRARVAPPEKKYHGPAKSGPTPVMDALKATFAKVAKGQPMDLLYLKPLAVGLEFDGSATPEAKATVSEWLLARKAALDEFAALADQKLEEVPEIDTGGWDGHLKHPKGQVQNTSQLMLADAARLADAKDYAGAVARCTAVIKWGRQLVNQGDPMVRATGAMVASSACRRVAALAQSADLSGVSGADVAAAVASFDFNDPARQMADLASDSKAAIEYLRGQFKGADAGEKYAQYLEEVGSLPVTELPGVSAAQMEELKPFLSLLPDKTFAEKARKMSEKEISAALDQAAAMVDPMVAAIQKGDQAALKGLLEKVKGDQTQVSRIALGGLGTILPGRVLTQDALSKAKAATEKMKK